MGRFFIAFFLFVIMLGVGDIVTRLGEIRDAMKGANDRQTCTLMAVNTPDGVASICTHTFGRQEGSPCS